MRVHLIDPSAYTPPYDRALASALAAAGADVRLTTSRFTAGDVPAAPGVTVDEGFYGHVPAGGRARVAAKLARHVPAMLRAARTPADVAHFQWLAVQPVDLGLLGAFRVPTVLTAHDVIPREPPGGRELMRAAQRRLYGAVDAVVVHSRHGADRLAGLGVDRAQIHEIPHGVLQLPAAGALPPELIDSGEPVVLLAGLLRPYKGIDVLVDAWRGITGAQLWIAGLPRMDVGPLRAAAPPGVQWATRFLTDPELGALLQRADLVVLPYREIDQSGVLFAALGAGRPLVLSDVGGFPEVAATGAAALVPPGDAEQLRATLSDLLGDEVARHGMAAAARRAAAERYAWEPIARAHLELYGSLTA